MKQILLGGVGLALAACAQAPVVGSGPGLFSATGDPVALQDLESIQIVMLGCMPQDWEREGWTRESLQALKDAQFEIADPSKRQAFAKQIATCLASPDPWLRDGIAYESLTHMLRAKQLDDATKRSLLQYLAMQLKAPDPLGFRQPFAALALSEVARADRVEAFLTDEERVNLLVEAQHWFINVKDYRGFDPVDGWRHAVAHGSDLLMQLALNPKIDAEGLRVIVSAVGVQAVQSETAFVDGEAERLARPILFAASRGALSEAEWTAWFKAIATPKDAETVFSSRAGLNWRNNTMAFLQALYVNVVVGSDPKDDVMRPGLEAALKAMP